MAVSHRFYRRSFLNRRGHHRGAYIIASSEIDSDTDRAGRAWIDATLTISDCDRVVSLDFWVDRPSDAANALHKARLLRDIVGAFTESLETSVEAWEAAGHDHGRGRR